MIPIKPAEGKPRQASAGGPRPLATPIVTGPGASANGATSQAEVAGLADVRIDQTELGGPLAQRLNRPPDERERAAQETIARENALQARGAQQSSANLEAIYKLVVAGDLGGMTADQRLAYYRSVCNSLGLNPLTRPFDFIWLVGDGGKKKLVMYATKECSAQLSRIYNVSVEILKVETFADRNFMLCWVRAKDHTGRFVDDVAGVPISANVKAEAAANAYMKLVTKAKRRGTLSFCGLGAMDEAEIDTIPGAAPFVADAPAPQATRPAPVAQPQAAAQTRPAPGAPALGSGGVRPAPAGAHPVASAYAQARAKAGAPASAPQARAPVTEPEVQDGGGDDRPSDVSHLASAEVVDGVVEETDGSQGSAQATGGAVQSRADHTVFKFEDKEHRQHLIKLVKERFPGISRDNIIKIAETYRYADNWNSVIEDLDAKKAGK